MKKQLRKLLITILSVSLIMPFSIASAHSGRTDAYGGHHDYNNVSGLGSYHYHHGYGPHLHNNGVCPYEASSSSRSSKSSSKASKTKKTNKKYQKMLNKLGYRCGTADGVLGSKSRKAIRKFQKKYKLTVTGNLNSKTKSKIKKVYNSKY
ncbi:MAG: peptidoglycan-binding protein [Lachnospiraceae bacterium]|nr:peptidoglycan-binding protein [Lachnospiraceae bacterium]